MRVLVTGAFGFLGLALLRRLVAGGHETIAFGRAPRSPLARGAVPPAARVVEGELRDVAPLVAEARPDAIVHLAGRPAPPLEAARVVVVSCLAAYGARDLGRPFRESDLADDGPAAAGRTVLRLATLYGAGAGVDLGRDGIVERYARAAARGGELVIDGDGAATLDLLHVDDACAAFLAALTVDDPPPVLNIGSGRPTTAGALASACLGAAHRLGRSPRVVVGDAAAPRAPERSLAIGLAQNRLGWRPQVKLQAGIDALVALMARSSP